MKTEMINLPAESVPIRGHYDVIVVGGGPAGVAAAIGAARVGAKVAIVERYGFLGGALTNALVVVIHSLWTKDGSLQVIGGLGRQFMNELSANGGAKNATKDLRGDFVVDPEAFKLLSDRYVLANGVHVMFHALLSTVVAQDGKIEAVVVTGKDGRMAMTADYFIDATGDGDLAFLAGAQMTRGREGDGLTQPGTLCFKVGGVNRELLEPGIIDIVEMSNILSEATVAGELPKQIGQIYTAIDPIRPDSIYINAVRLIEKDCTTTADLSASELEGRQQILKLMNVLSKRIPAFKHAFIEQIAPQVGWRESRRLVGEYITTRTDLMECRQFEDTIAQGTYRIDIHNPTGSGTLFEEFSGQQFYQIPLRSLVPKEISNLLVAGRCLSATHEALGGIRVMINCMSMGQAAGIAAALSLSHRRHVLDIVPSIQTELLRQDAILNIPK